MTLGRAVYARRVALGISQSELARRAQTTQPAISRLEAGGGGVPTLAVLDRLGRALGVRFSLTVGADSEIATEGNLHIRRHHRLRPDRDSREPRRRPRAVRRPLAADNRRRCGTVPALPLTDAVYTVLMAVVE
ncbi:helix-turn-helix domain-containing protein [Nocardia caishijiensis]|uniref:helix-turn-helix domain-containing protein n=1 Tax=Nocardia caishijiensis TaxID=184756 RepID=UPI0038B27E04